jgi:hypothetical protein
MYNYSFESENDDDIFDDSKNLSDARPTNKSSFTETKEESDSLSSSSFKDVIDTLIGDDDEDNSSPTAHLILTFYSSATSWVKHKSNECFQKALHTYFIDQQEGKAKDFVYYERYFDAQSQLLRRRIINIFVRQIVDNPQKIAAVSSRLNLSLDERFIATYFGSFYNVNQFNIIETYSVYKSLAQYLSLPFEADLDDEDDSQHKLPVDYDSFSSNLFNTSIIKDEELKNILSEVLSETIKKFVNIKVEEDDIED